MISSVSNECGVRYGFEIRKNVQANPQRLPFYKDLLVISIFLKHSGFPRNVRIRISSNMQHLSDTRGLLVRNIIFVITVIIRIRFNYLI